jgi:diguanylate cyclase (GGDEF)-like protein/PAS domain S-box-containing protein
MTGPWKRFAHAHLSDYPPPLQRFWLAEIVAGGLALAWALQSIAGLPRGDLAWVAAGLLAVAVATRYAVSGHDGRYTLSATDFATFVLLASFGPAAATLALGLDGLLTALRLTPRLRSRLAAPCTAMAAMAVTGFAFEAIRAVLTRLGVPDGIALLAALCAVALVPFAIVTLVVGVLATARGEPFAPRRWLVGLSGAAAIYLGSAFVAGLVELCARQFGQGVLAIALGASLVLVLLVHASMQHGQAEKRANAARVAEAEREAQASQQRFASAFTHAAIGMAIVRTSDECMLQVNDALAALARLPVDALVGRRFSELLHPDDLPLLREATATMADVANAAFSIEIRAAGTPGDEVWISLHGSRYEAPGNGPPGLIYQVHDITARRVAERRLQHIAYFDGLTDLANRNSFHERLATAIERTRLDARAHFGVMFLDLDGFKIFNDSLGHFAGNALLRAVAERLQLCVRPDDLVARLGGDEFAILIEGLKVPDDGMQLAQRVLETLRQPLTIERTEVIPAASIGITFSDLGYRSVDEVLRDADLAMYEAKAAGRARVALFDSSMHERVADRLALEADLRNAIGEGQMSVHFQPIFRLDSQSPVSFEALIRWSHPVRGNVGPATFIPLAEETGQISALTDWVMERSVRQVVAWNQEVAQGNPVGVHVNVSGRDLARSDFAERVQLCLVQYGLPASKLTLEITESTLMAHLDVAMRTLATLREIGVGLAIDDFGTGYSSLAYLRNLPITELKIDRSFVAALEDGPKNLEIVRAVLTLGHSLGCGVVAEGIETDDQLALLRRAGVHYGQGYRLSRPLPASQVPPLLCAMAH